MSAQIFRGKFIFPRCIYIVIFKIMFCHSSSSWYPAFPGITQCVTPNPFCYFCLILICNVVVISSCHAPLTHAAWLIFLQSFTFAMKHSQVCKWCISSAEDNKYLVAHLFLLFAVSFLPALSSQLAKEYSRALHASSLLYATSWPR